MRDASGLGRMTIRASGIPRDAALVWAARVKELVITLTEGRPRDSVMTVSWRPHAVQEPQSAMPCTTASHSSIRELIVSSEQGALKENFFA